MSDPAISPQPGEVEPGRIAALLDGKLSGEERTAALVEVVRSEDGVAQLVETGAVLRSREASNAAIPRESWSQPLGRRGSDGFYGSGI